LWREKSGQRRLAEPPQLDTTVASIFVYLLLACLLDSFDSFVLIPTTSDRQQEPPPANQKSIAAKKNYMYYVAVLRSQQELWPDAPTNEDGTVIQSVTEAVLSIEQSTS
jgi:hypothetical protein